MASLVTPVKVNVEKEGGKEIKKQCRYCKCFCYAVEDKLVINEELEKSAEFLITIHQVF